MRIGWIGAGVMGAPMAGHLLDAGHQIAIHSRTQEKAQPLIERGAEWAVSAMNAAEGADVVFSIVGYPSDVDSVHLGAEGTLAAKRLPRAIVDMTTSTPTLAQSIADAARARGVESIDAPVSGGDVGARNATLSIMVGGSDAGVALVQPLLEKLGSIVVHHGSAGAGQHAKMVNQTLIATNIIGVCEGLIYARKAGLDPAKVIQSVGAGAAGSWSINNLGPRMIARDFAPGFYVEHFIKDLAIALEETERMELSLPGLALARALYESVRDLGHSRSGTQSLLLALEALNRLEDDQPRS